MIFLQPPDEYAIRFSQPRLGPDPHFVGIKTSLVLARVNPTRLFSPPHRMPDSPTLLRETCNSKFINLCTEHCRTLTTLTDLLPAIAVIVSSSTGYIRNVADKSPCIGLPRVDGGYLATTLRQFRSRYVLFNISRTAGSFTQAKLRLHSPSCTTPLARSECRHAYEGLPT